jgi:hypothetical protein
LPLIAMQILMILVISVSARQKVLVIVNNGFYRGSYADLVDNYCNDIINLEYKNVEVIPWIIDPGTNVQECTTVLQRLQNEYIEARNAGDVLEGAVLIGDIPVPQYSGGYGYMPLDQVYMDVVDGSGNRYEPPIAPDYTPFLISGSYYAGITPPPLEFLQYDQAIGNEHYDIWISRINAEYMHGIREGLTIYDNHAAYASYLDRVKARMNEPASVPSRGFYMGGPEDLINAYQGLGQYLNELHLPWIAEFTGGHNSSFNWMSQLLAGPRGCINYGACNGTLFSMSERNRRFCRYEHLPNVYMYANGVTTQYSNLQINDPNDPTDSLGWEWAGLYNHSCPWHTNFFSNDGTPSELIKLNGEFKFGTIGSLWGSAYEVEDPQAWEGRYHYYQDYPTDPDPYNYGFGWKNKGAEWRWRVPPGGAGDYEVFLYYIPRYENCVSVYVTLHVVRVNASGLPISYEHIWRKDTINQRTHLDHPLPENNWERLFVQTQPPPNPPITTVTLNEEQMAIVSLQLNDGLWGDHIVDAVRFIRTNPATPVVNETVDDDQGNYDEPVDDPSTIFSTTGFRSTDDVYRGFEDMGSEPGGGGFSKTQFFLTNACSINDFIITTGTTDKNVGNLYALGYNGLICMGMTESDAGGDDKGPYTRALRDGNCFGQAFLAKINSPGMFGYRYALLGAGTLRAQPYVQFRSDVIQDQVINDMRLVSTNNPVLIRNVTVNGNGNLNVVTDSTTGSPFGMHSEIVVRPETVFSPTGINEVHLLAN